MAKAEFKWDSEKLIHVIENKPQERHEIRMCTLGDKTYVSDTKRVFIKKDEEWKVVKNQVTELSVFEEMYEA